MTTRLNYLSVVSENHVFSKQDDSKNYNTHESCSYHGADTSQRHSERKAVGNSTFILFNL